MHPHDPDDGLPAEVVPASGPRNSPARPRPSEPRGAAPSSRAWRPATCPRPMRASASVHHASRPATPTVQEQSRAVLQELEARAAGQGAHAGFPHRPDGQEAGRTLPESEGHPEIRQPAVWAQLGHADDPDRPGGESPDLHRPVERPSIPSVRRGSPTGPAPSTSGPRTAAPTRSSSASSTCCSSRRPIRPPRPTPGDPLREPGDRRRRPVRPEFPPDGQSRRARPQQHPRRRGRSRCASDPTELDIRRQHQRGQLRRPGDSPRGRGSWISSGSPTPTRSRGRWARVR